MVLHLPSSCSFLSQHRLCSNFCHDSLASHFVVLAHSLGVIHPSTESAHKCSQKSFFPVSIPCLFPGGIHLSKGCPLVPARLGHILNYYFLAINQSSDLDLWCWGLEPIHLPSTFPPGCIISLILRGQQRKTAGQKKEGGTFSFLSASCRFFVNHLKLLSLPQLQQVVSAQKPNFSNTRRTSLLAPFSETKVIALQRKILCSEIWGSVGALCIFWTPVDS